MLNLIKVFQFLELFLFEQLQRKKFTIFYIYKNNFGQFFEVYDILNGLQSITPLSLGVEI